MRIGLITDTHVPEVQKILPTEIAKVFDGVELILHAGDIYFPGVLDELEHIAPVLAAIGDDDYLVLGDKRVKERHVLKLEGQTVWLIHELPYFYMSRLVWQDRKVANWAEPAPVDAPNIIVFGHEHRAIVQSVENVLLVNSGSPTFLYYRHGLGTVGILNIEGGKAEASIIQLQNGNRSLSST